MSSVLSSLSPSTAHQSTQLLTPTSQPIPLLSTPLAKGYGYAFTVGVVFYYYLRSSALVSDPLVVLVQDLVPLAIFQSLFCAICLPISGSWNSGTGESSRGGKGAEGNTPGSKNISVISGTGAMKRRAGGPAVPSKAVGAGRLSSSNVAGGSWQSRVMPTTLSLILTLSIPPVPLAVLALVLGAPLYPTTLIPHTFVLAIQVALLGLLPIFYTHGVSSTAWRDVAAAWLPFDEAGVWGGAVGTMVGGWVGAIPIALDWDREWQKWPCTVVWGAVLGWAVGRLLTFGLRMGVGNRINLSAANTHDEKVKLEGVAQDVKNK